MIALTDVEADHIVALHELVESGCMSWQQAVNDFRAEFSCCLRYCYDIGLVKRLQDVDTMWASTLKQQTKLQFTNET